MFIEMVIVLLIAFEVIVEMHALGWIALPGHPLPAVAAPSNEETEPPPVALHQSPLKKRHSQHK